MAAAPLCSGQIRKQQRDKRGRRQACGSELSSERKFLCASIQPHSGACCSNSRSRRLSAPSADEPQAPTRAIDEDSIFGCGGVAQPVSQKTLQRRTFPFSTSATQAAVTSHDPGITLPSTRHLPPAVPNSATRLPSAKFESMEIQYWG